MDAYQQAVEYLTANPSSIKDAWFSPGTRKGGCLFTQAMHPSFMGDRRCGCLTMIRNDFLCYVAQTDELSDAIKADARLPVRPEDVKVDHLPVFAGWQRRIDQALGRTPPPLDPRLPAPAGDIEIPAPEAAQQLS